MWLASLPPAAMFVCSSASPSPFSLFYSADAEKYGTGDTKYSRLRKRKGRRRTINSYLISEIPRSTPSAQYLPPLALCQKLKAQWLVKGFKVERDSTVGSISLQHVAESQLCRKHVLRVTGNWRRMFWRESYTEEQPRDATLPRRQLGPDNSEMHEENWECERERGKGGEE